MLKSGVCGERCSLRCREACDTIRWSAPEKNGRLIHVQRLKLSVWRKRGEARPVDVNKSVSRATPDENVATNWKTGARPRLRFRITHAESHAARHTPV